MRFGAPESVTTHVTSYDPSEVNTVEVSPLDTKKQAIELAKSMLGTEDESDAKKLVHSSDGNSLIITIGGTLIRNGKIEISLLENI